MSKEYQGFFHMQRVEFNSTKPQKYLMRAGGYIIAIGTITFTAMMWWQNQESAINKTLYTALSIGLGLGEFVLWPISLNALTRGAWIRAIPSAIAGTFCFFFSMSGTVGYMAASGDFEIQQESQIASINEKQKLAFAAISKSLEDSSQSAAIQRETQSRFNSMDRLTKASDIGKNLLRIERQKSENINKLIKEAHEKPVEIKTKAPLLSLYKSIYSIIKTDGSNLTLSDVKKWFEIIFAISVEITGICLLSSGKNEEIEIKAFPSDPLKDGTDPKGKRPSLEKKESTNKESLTVQTSPLPVTIGATLAENVEPKNPVITESVTTENQGVNLAKTAPLPVGVSLTKNEVKKRKYRRVSEKFGDHPEKHVKTTLRPQDSLKIGVPDSLQTTEGDSENKLAIVKKNGKIVIVKHKKTRSPKPQKSRPDHYAKAKELIESGRLKCSINSVKNQFAIGYVKAKSYFDRMVEGGVVRQTEDGYELVNKPKKFKVVK